MTTDQQWKGKKWCNGDCEWTDWLFNYKPNEDGTLSGTSVKKQGNCIAKKCCSSGDVSCGKHRAPTCPECPINTITSKYEGKSWCFGDCMWAGEEAGCISKVHDLGEEQLPHP